MWFNRNKRIYITVLYNTQLDQCCTTWHNDISKKILNYFFCNWVIRSNEETSKPWVSFFFLESVSTEKLTEKRKSSDYKHGQVKDRVYVHDVTNDVAIWNVGSNDDI